jgi:hypothetical protein
MLSVKDKFEVISDDESDDEFEVISEEIREQLNENFKVYRTYNTRDVVDDEFEVISWEVVDDKNQINININKGNTQKLESTKIIQIYNELREFKNNINKQFNLDCLIEIYYDINELIQYISIKYDKNNIEAINYIELTKKLKKIEELKNKILSVKKNKYFKFSISHSDYDIDNIIYTNIVLTNIINNTRISIKYNIIETFEIYNQLSEYLNINSNEWIDYNCDIIMSSNKEDSITVNCFNNGCLNTVNYSVYDRFNIYINNKNIISIIKISNEVKKYIKSIECNKKPIIYNFYAKYDENVVENINLILEDSNGDKIRIEANNYIELTRKIRLEPEERLKEKEKEIIEKMALQLKEDIIVKDITNNSFSILGEYTNTEYKIKINVKYYNIGKINICKIYNEVKNQIIRKYVVSHIEIDYSNSDTNSSITKITLKYNDCIFSGNSCIECNKKIEEYIKEQEKTALKLKYGDKTDLLKSFNHICISDVDIEYIDLLDFIPYNKEKIICDGKIIDIFKSNDKNSVITIKNCYNLKKINNYVFGCIENYERGSLLNGFNNTSIFKNINIKIINCPKLEFIEYYDKFIITIDDKMVYRIKQDDLSKIKEENSEIKSLLKDQQEYAHIIQSLLKRINKLENKAVENE